MRSASWRFFCSSARRRCWHWPTSRNRSRRHCPRRKWSRLSGKMKVSEALAALTRQTGIVVEDRRGEPDAVHDFENSKDTFWRVLDHIAAVADAQVDLYCPTANSR